MIEPQLTAVNSEAPEQLSRPADPAPQPGGEPGEAPARQPGEAQPPAPEGETSATPAAAPVPYAAQPAPPPEQPQPPVTPVPRRRWGLVLGIASGAVAVGVVAAVGFMAINLLREDLPTAGDCLTDAPAVADMVITDCGSDDAFWLVVGHDGTWRHGDFEAAAPGEVCAGFPSTLQALWMSDRRMVTDDTEGEVVCLEPLSSTE